MKLGLKKRIRLLFILGIFAVLFVHNSPHYESYRRIHRLNFCLSDEDLKEVMHRFSARGLILIFDIFILVWDIPAMIALVLLLTTMFLSSLIEYCILSCKLIKYLNIYWRYV